MTYQLGFLGAGNMAFAIAQSALRAGLLAPADIIASDPSPSRRDLFASLAIRAVPDNAAVIESSRQILIAVKPQIMPAAAADLARHRRPDHIILSIMAGISIAKLTAALSPLSHRERAGVRVLFPRLSKSRPRGDRLRILSPPPWGRLRGGLHIRHQTSNITLPSPASSASCPTPPSWSAAA